MIELCIQLRDKVRELEAVIQAQDARLNVLENSSTKSKIAMLHERNKNRSRDQAEEGNLRQHAVSNSEIQVLPSQPGDDHINSPGKKTSDADEAVADGAMRQPKNVNSEPQVPLSQHTEKYVRGNSSDDGFRLSSTERKKIRQGKIGLNAAVGQRDIRRSSTGSHRISAAFQPNKD